MTVRHPCRAATFLYRLIECCGGGETGNCSNSQNSAVGLHHSADHTCDGAIGVAGGYSSFFDQSADALCEKPVTLLVNQSWLDDRVTSPRNPPVTAKHGVAFEDMTRAQDVGRGSDLHKSAQRPSAAESICEIERPAARSPQRDRWRLHLRITHCANFIHQLHLNWCTADLSRQIANRPIHFRRLAIDV